MDAVDDEAWRRGWELKVFGCASARAGYLSGCIVALGGGITSRRSVV